jgi:hypothetical protein
VAARPASDLPHARNDTYRPVGAALGDVASDRIGEIGVTLWRLRASRPADAARLLVHEPGTGDTQWTPERVELGMPLSAGERVRMSVEAPRDGYLYVIDRERFSDGTTGEPFLIFPTKRTIGGDNRLAAGRLVDIPSQADRPPFFTITRSRADQNAELITLIVSAEPLKDAMVPDDRVQLPSKLVDEWERQGATAPVQRLEMVGGAGRAWSIEEQRAAADGTRRLTQNDPGPQTLFRVVTSTPGLLVAQLTLAQASR